MANFCHNCANAVTASMRACPNCGTQLADASSGATATTSAPQAPDGTMRGFGSYAPPHQSPRPLSSNSHLGAALSNAATYPRAGLGARFMAHIIDVIVGLLGFIPVLFAVVLFESGEPALEAAGAFIVLAGLGWTFYYTFTKDGWSGGASVGKRAMGLMVVHLPTNEPCTQGKSALRQFIWMLLQIVPVIGWLVEPIAVLVADGGRRLGDLVAGTQVIEASEYRA